MQKHQGLAVERRKTVVERMTSIWPLNDWINSEILVAVSGGPDSVALLRLMYDIKRQNHQATAELHVIHVNHQTRPSSDSDQRFVTELADQLGLTVHAVRNPSIRSEVDAASEQDLRQYRYEAICAVAHQFGIRLIATAHTLDDQIETLLFRLARGTGLYGLKGIPAVRVEQAVSIVRPLLRVRKSELLRVLEDLDQPYCIDESNSNSDYTRNFLRNQIIPDLSEKFGRQFDQSLQRIAEQANEQMQFLDDLAAPLIVRDQRQIDVKLMADAHPVIVRHALRMIWKQADFQEAEMTAEKWKRLQQFVCRATDGHLQLPGGITAKLSEAKLTFVPTATDR